MKVIASSWALALAFLAGPAASASLSLTPAPATVQEGQTTWLDVVVSDVTGLYAFQFDMHFDPAVVQVGEVLEGGFLQGLGGPTGFVPGSIDNVGGTVSFTANLLFGAAAGASGDGVLARFSFKGLAPGHSELELSNVVLLDASLTDIPATSFDGAINVTAVPEPASGLLAALGLAAIAARRRRGLLSPASA